MGKNRHHKTIAALAAVLVLGLTAVSGAATYTPGSENDPVVTKSYVDGLISELEESLAGSGSGTTGDSQGAYEPLQIAAGKTFAGGEGTEVILRSGEATAIDNGANGISDITTGSDLRTGDAVQLNHLLLIPREDGRGIKASTDIWVLVRGSYEVK